MEGSEGKQSHMVVISAIIRVSLVLIVLHTSYLRIAISCVAAVVAVATGSQH